MKILSTDQIRAADAYTIAQEPIASLDLMERAARAFTGTFTEIFPEPHPVAIFCGVGNNGGDGLAIGRLLAQEGWTVSIFTLGNLEKNSDDFLQNFRRLPSSVETRVHLESEEQFPDLAESTLVIDGLFGSGLDRPIEGLAAQLIDYLNRSPAQIVAIDLASGLVADAPRPGPAVIEPIHTITFQAPKLAFFLPENHLNVGHWHVVDIGLHPDFLHSASSEYRTTEIADLLPHIPRRTRYMHKGAAGRLVLVAGARQTLGAAVLSAEAAFRSGVGLLYVQTTKNAQGLFLTRLPEAMIFEDSSAVKITKISVPIEPQALALGPGIGTDKATADAVKSYLKKTSVPTVIDADGLNLLSQHDDLYQMLPENTILTPHPGEFARLVGTWTNDYEKLEKLKTLATTRKMVVVLKGAYTAIALPNGDICFNTTGNPGLATAGSGDVLTGIIGAFLAQGLAPAHAALLAVYLHGKAGDHAARQLGEISLKSTDIIDFLPASLLEMGGK